MQIDKKIERFIGRHHVLTLATATADGAPYCCNCFYAYDAETAAFIFTTDPATDHGKMMCENSRVAASIVLETRTVGKIHASVSLCVRISVCVCLCVHVCGVCVHVCVSVCVHMLVCM